MTFAERIKLIITECNLKQIDFATTLGVSPNYISQLVNGKKTNISETLAKLIEETYGYSAQWIMEEKGEKKIKQSFSLVKSEFLKKIQKMPDEEVLALLAFAESLNNVKQSFKTDREDEEIEKRVEEFRNQLIIEKKMESFCLKDLEKKDGKAN